MLIATDQSNADVITNRINWLATQGVSIADTTRVRIVYEGADYRRYHVAAQSEKGAGMKNELVIHADALVTTNANHALFLPVADCVGAVLHDPTKRVLMVSHLGRHSLEQNGGYHSVQFLIATFGCNPANIRIYLTPAAGSDTYPLFAFDNQSLKEVTHYQLTSAGILLANIADDTTETTRDLNYYSHSDFLRGNRPSDGRHAVVAFMTD